MKLTNIIKDRRVYLCCKLLLVSFRFSLLFLSCFNCCRVTFVGAGKLSKLLNSAMKGRKYSSPIQDNNRLFFFSFLSTGKSASKSVNEWCRRVPCLQGEWVIITHRCIVLGVLILFFWHIVIISQMTRNRSGFIFISKANLVDYWKQSFKKEKPNIIS